MFGIKLLIVIFLVTSVNTANAQAVLVCQTPWFWCSIFAPGFFGDQPCWCNSGSGPINGYTIIPYVPQDQRPSNTRIPPPNPGEDVVILDPNEEDCLNGLGNCSGAFEP
jgi:hypothetical protein